MLIDKIRTNFYRFSPYKGKNYSFQNILLDNIVRMANFMSDKDHKELRFHIPPINLERNDYLELQKRILTMTPAERKRFGINKSTLWYQKRRMEQGKIVKIYGKVLSRIA